MVEKCNVLREDFAWDHFPFVMCIDKATKDLETDEVHPHFLKSLIVYNSAHFLKTNEIVVYC